MKNKYNEITKGYVPKVISSKAEFELASKIIDDLSIKASPTPEEAEYLETLTILMEAYDAKASPATTMPNHEMLKSLMESSGMDAAEVAKVLGCDKSLVYKLASGERSLTVSHIEALCAHFHLSAGAFIKSPVLTRVTPVADSWFRLDPLSEEVDLGLSCQIEDLETVAANLQKTTSAVTKALIYMKQVSVTKTVKREGKASSSVTHRDGRYRVKHAR